jgi:hypothetical protein
VPIPKKLAVPSCPDIQPDFREFLDEILVPMLVRDALREISNEIDVAPALSIVGKSPRRQEGQ